MTETNAITNYIVNFLIYNGHFASRIQSQGQYIPKLNRFVKSKVRKGIGDIIACIDGKFVMIEVKYGKDRQSVEQKQVEKDVKKSGGQYWIIKTAEMFINHYESYYNNSNASKVRNYNKSDKRSVKKSGKNKHNYRRNSA